MGDLLTEASYRTALIEQSSATILVLDHSMKLKDWNQGSLPMFETHLQPKAGIPIKDVLESGPGADKLLAAMDAGLAGKTTSEHEMQLNIRGSYRSYVWNLTPYQDDKQRLAGLICIGQDVTSSRQAQQAAAHSARLVAMGEMTTSVERLSCLDQKTCHKKKPHPKGEALLYGAPGTIRTYDRLIRSQVLYPAELRARRGAIILLTLSFSSPKTRIVQMSPYAS